MLKKITNILIAISLLISGIFSILIILIIILLINAIFTKTECNPVFANYNISITCFLTENPSSSKDTFYFYLKNTIRDGIIFEKIKITEIKDDDYYYRNISTYEANSIIDKEKMVSLAIETLPEGFCYESEPTVNLSGKKDLKLTINGKNYFDQTEEERKIHYQGNKIDTYIVNASWKDKSKVEKKYNIHWLTTSEFEAKKEELIEKWEENNIEYTDFTIGY